MRRLILAGLSLALPVHAQEALVGVWSGGDQRPPITAGPIVLTRNLTTWTLQAGDRRATAPVDGALVELALPDDAGSLRVVLPTGARPVTGLWTQPAMNGYGYVTPVHLRPTGTNTWQGTVSPLEERVTLQLRVWRRADGAMVGRFRNPEFGWNLGRTFLVAARDSVLELRDPGTGAVRFSQPYDAGRGAITFDFGSPFILRRVATTTARVPPYATPRSMDDEWRVANAGSRGFDLGKLTSVVRGLQAADPFGDSTVLVHSLLVARRGALVLDAYFHGFDADRLHDTRSAFKTATSIAVGAAMRGGAALSLTTPVFALMDTTRLARDSIVAAITLKHLLTHTTGLACDDNDDNSPGNEERMQRQRQQLDWSRYTLALGVLHTAGTRYAYCSGTMHLAASMVTRATGEWYPAFLARAVAAPLGIRRYALNLTPSREGYGGGGAYLRPRDLLKFGQLYLDGGLWRGRRVVDTSWVRASIAHQASTADGGSDGLAWHRYRIRAAGRDWDEYEASGNGGQMVMVVPELHLVVGTTAGNYNRYGTWRRIREDILPAIIESLR